MAHGPLTVARQLGGSLGLIVLVAVFAVAGCADLANLKGAEHCT